MASSRVRYFTGCEEGTYGGPRRKILTYGLRCQKLNVFSLLHYLYDSISTNKSSAPQVK